MSQQDINVTSLPQYKYVDFFMMLFVSIFLVCETTAWRMVDIFGHPVPASGLVIAIVFFLGDIIAEVYGYHISRKLIWNTLVCQIIFGLTITLVIHLPTLSSAGAISDSYELTFEHLLRTNLISLLSVTSGMFANAFLISKLKIRMYGKKFIFRVILSSAISEAILCIIAYTTLFIGEKDFLTILNMIFLIWVYKVIFAVFSAPFAPLISDALKKLEQCDIYDFGMNYSPFRYSRSR